MHLEKVLIKTNKGHKKRLFTIFKWFLHLEPLNERSVCEKVAKVSLMALRIAKFKFYGNRPENFLLNYFFLNKIKFLQR